MASVITSHYKIVEYWKDKLITKDGRVITWDDYNQAKETDAMLIIDDLGEPSCWACGEPAAEWKERKYYEWLENEDYKSIWESKIVKHKLNRCHIIPGMLNGKDIAENLFLLCENCHHLSPDTSNPGTFIRWVYRTRKQMSHGRPNADSILKYTNEELESRGLPDIYGIFRIIYHSNKRDEIENRIKNDDIYEKYIYANTGLHGYSVSDSSLYGSFADVLEKLYYEVVKG